MQLCLLLIRSLCIGLLAALAHPATALAQEMQVSVADAWVRLMPPGQSVSAGYLTLTNSADQPVLFTRADSPAAGRVEFHTRVMDAGMMRMRPLVNIAGAATRQPAACSRWRTPDVV